MRSIGTYIDILRKKGLGYAFRETWRNAAMPYVSNMLLHTYTPESFAKMLIHKRNYKHAINYHLYIQ